jgi:hypothetical protein
MYFLIYIVRDPGRTLTWSSQCHGIFPSPCLIYPAFARGKKKATTWTKFPENAGIFHRTYPSLCKQLVVIPSYKRR